MLGFEYLSDVVVFDTNSPKFIDVNMEPKLNSTTIILKDEYLINRIIKLEQMLIDKKFPEKIYSDVETKRIRCKDIIKCENFNGMNLEYFFIEKCISNFWRIKPRGFYGLTTCFLNFMNYDIIIVTRNQNLKNSKNFLNCKNYIIEFKKLNPNIAPIFKNLKIHDVIYGNIYHSNYRPVDLFVPKWIRVAVNGKNIFVRNLELETSSMRLMYDNYVHDYEPKSNEYLKSKFGWKFFFVNEKNSYFTYEKIKDIIEEPFKIKLHMNEKEILKMMIKYPKLF